jgi:hypothetical protein
MSWNLSIIIPRTLNASFICNGTLFTVVFDESHERILDSFDRVTGVMDLGFAVRTRGYGILRAGTKRKTETNCAGLLP